LIRIILRKFHHYVSGCSDNLSSKENVFQPKGLDLLTVFRSLCEVHLEQQEQIVGQHHQLKDRFIGQVVGIYYLCPVGWMNIFRRVERSMGASALFYAQESTHPIQKALLSFRSFFLLLAMIP
jgi:hypothetical protein